MSNRIEAIKKELSSLEQISNCSYNNEGLYNEMRIMREKLEKELKALLKEQGNESEENR